jgi:hypothetical protein
VLGGFALAHRFFGLEMDPMRSVDEAIQDGVMEEGGATQRPISHLLSS